MGFPFANALWCFQGRCRASHRRRCIDQVAHVFPEYYVLKVSGFDLKIKDTLDEWIYALKESEVKPEFTAKGIHEASRALTRLSLSDEERQAYERHIGDVRISKSTLVSSFSDGLHQGVAQGRAEIIMNLHRSGLPPEKIAELAGVNLQEVQEMIGVASASSQDNGAKTIF